jgi:cytochrome c peroxidase
MSIARAHRLPLPSRCILAAALALGWCGQAVAHQAVEPAILKLVRPAGSSPPLTGAALIERGRQLFVNETFGGNGRTCGTCHPASNNFTLDPKYIATLKPSDPLFVAERVPALASLENPTLLRRFALITENLDGFDQPGVLRSVPHTLGLSQTIAPDKGVLGTRAAFPLAAATGWSGDGAPADGSLRNFALGAVVQHMPRTLSRVPGTDFRVPTSDELDALLAFQLSLGRQQEYVVDPADPSAMVFRDAVVEDGRHLFHSAPTRQPSDTRSCGGCHSHAGANDKDGNNRLFATGTELQTNAPPCLAPGLVPGDGGFGRDTVTTRDGIAVCGGTSSFTITYRGTGSFNTPSLVEAADTPPYFHNNTAATLEDAINFYTTDAFNSSTAGNGRAFVLTADGVKHIAAFLRALNAVENLREAMADIDQAANLQTLSGTMFARMAGAQLGDAIRDVANNGAELFRSANLPAILVNARAAIAAAISTRNPALLAAQKAALLRAQSLMIQ